MRTFVINLDSATDRWAKYKDDLSYERWSATHYDEMYENDPIFKKMVSYHNIDPDQHRSKCACFRSHTSIWHYIVTNKMNDILILEDDAIKVNDIPDDLPQDGFTFLGGFTSHKKITDGPKKIDFEDGIHEIDHAEYKMIMCLAIYIPKWEVAYKMLQAAEGPERCRAIDTMIYKAHVPQYVSYPASFVEEPIASQIRSGKNKFSNSKYEWLTRKQLLGRP